MLLNGRINFGQIILRTKKLIRLINFSVVFEVLKLLYDCHVCLERDLFSFTEVIASSKVSLCIFYLDLITRIQNCNLHVLNLLLIIGF